jgi:hypothetical protein
MSLLREYPRYFPDFGVSLVVMNDGSTLGLERALVTRDAGVWRLVSPVVVLAVTALAAVSLFTAGSAAASTGQQKFTIYSVATQEQFMNMSDDRARGKGNTPFGNFKDTSTPTKESGVGPFPGDIALFGFALFTNSDLKTSAGSGVFTCQYNFNQNAFCDVSYQLSGGTLICAGAFNFNAKTFTLSIKGGTGKYVGMKGNIAALPAVNHAQRLNFVLNQ